MLMPKLVSFTRWKLQWKFLFIFIVLIILPMLAFSLYIYSQANHAVQLQAIDNTRGHLEKIDQNIAAVLQDIEDISSYMIYSEDIRNYLSTPALPENRTYLNDLEAQINGFATFHLTSKNFLDSISLEGNNHTELNIGTPLGQTSEDNWKHKAKQLEGKVFWSDTYTIKDYWDRESKVISLYRVINDINNVTKPLGMVTIRLRAEKLYELIDRDTRNSDKIFVVNQNGIVVIHPDYQAIGKTYPDQAILNAISRDPDQSLTLNLKNKKNRYNVVTEPVEGTGLIVVGVVNEAAVAEGITPIQHSIRLMMIALTIFGIFALFGFYHFNIKRIKDLAKQTKQVEKGDFSAKVAVRSGDEIGVLGMRFNKMVEQLKHLIENVYQMEIRNRESELKLLQSQINPHFLYNTLDMIRWTARLENAMETSKLIEQLSKMFRISLNRGKPWISLKDELTYSRSYLDLQQRRLGDKLDYTVYWEDGILDAVVLKQTIQPLIENSLQHGFENVRTLRKIYIRCFKLDGSLVIDVIDNGKGFPDSNIQTHIQNGYALQNIKDRLAMAFGDKADISIEDMYSRGAWIRIKHPFITDMSEIQEAKSEGDSNDSKSSDR